MTRKIPTGALEKLTSVVVNAVRLTAAIFRRPQTLTYLIDNIWEVSFRRADREIHSGVKAQQRFGFAAMAPDLTVLGHGLHSAQWAGLRDQHIPTTLGELINLLTTLVARSPARDQTRIEAVVDVMVQKFAGSDQVRDIPSHARSLFSFQSGYPDFYRAAVAGNLHAAFAFAKLMPDSIDRKDAIRAASRQGIIWSAFDVHRTAARGVVWKTSMVPRFLRPLIRTFGSGEYAAVCLSLANLIERLYRAQDLANSRLAFTKINLFGPKGILVRAFLIEDDRLNSLCSQNTFDAIEVVQPLIRKRALEYAAAFAPLTTRRSGNQLTLHQHYFDGLSPIAALFVVALRHAQAEKLLTELIANPDAPIRVSHIVIPPFLDVLPPGTVTRAQQIVAVYRSAILRDVHRKREGEFNSSTAEEALKSAHAFLKRAAAPQRTRDTASAMINLDLAHWVRSPLFSVATGAS